MSANRKLVNRFRPSVENLENRDLMSVTSVTLNAGVLRVELDNANDFVRIGESSVEFTTATMAAAPVAGLALTSRDDSSVFLRTITVTDATRNDAHWTFNRSLVQKVLVENHNSFGDINTIVSTSSLPTVVDLRNSNSTNHVETGAGNDTVWGSDGKDSIWTNAGNDAIAAGAGDDRIDGGAGADSMFGGLGNDTLIDAISSTDANLIYGDAGNDSLFSASKNDVVDGGTEIDTASVKTGTWIVRNAENVFITDVPTGNAVTTFRATARQAANRFLQAYGLPIITHAIQLNDSTSGLTASRMVSLVRESKPDATLVTGVTSGTIINILRTGKPVLAKLGSGWAVYTGYNAATKVFTYVGISGQQKTTTLSATTKRDLIY